MKIEISGKHITIGQLLKREGFISTGGGAKNFLEKNSIKINGRRPMGRSTKVKINDTLWINDDLYKIVEK